jgi:ABC-type polysaccharide/polyol phosphate transport system ATPase subunit
MDVISEISTCREGDAGASLGTKKVFLEADQVGVTFPARGNVVQSDGDVPSDSRLIWSKSGRLRGVQALRDVSFRLSQGDRIAIVGQNGSGKTTLLQVLAGIIAPEVGRIRCHGRITSLININLGIQAEATGHRNITLRGLAAGYSHREIEARRQEIADFSELEEFLDMPMDAYSAGMRMRLTFAIATAFEPEILILDEWLSAGDTSFKEKATRRMQNFVERAGILILASHSPNLILNNCDTGIWLDEGRIRAIGDVQDILKQYDAHQKAR